MSMSSRAALLSLAVVLAACGGGGGTGTPAPAVSTPPPTAAAGPVITAQPVSQSVVAGQAVTFSVAADSTATGYQWQRDGKDIPGATGLTYTLANPQAADNGGKFTAVVTGTRGTTVSAAAVLGVSVPKGLALVAGNPGGIGNLDGTDARLALPGLLAMQPSGALYLVDDVDGLAFSPSVRSIDPATGSVTTLARDPALHDARAIAVDAAGNLYDAPWATGPATAIYRTPPGGKRMLFAGAAGEAGSTDGAATAARFTEIGSLAADAAGNLYVNDGGKAIRKAAQDGTVSTLAGGAQAEFQQIGALASDRAGNLTKIYGVRTGREQIDAEGKVGHATQAGVKVINAKNADPTEVSNALWPASNGQAFGTRLIDLSDYDVASGRSYKGPSSGQELHGTYSDASIGRDYSHGCVGLRNADIEEIFGQVRNGELVRFDS